LRAHGPRADVCRHPEHGRADVCRQLDHRGADACRRDPPGTEHQKTGREAMADEDDRPPQLQETIREKARGTGTASAVSRSREIVQSESIDIPQDHRASFSRGHDDVDAGECKFTERHVRCQELSSGNLLRGDAAGRLRSCNP
jgi:hypothetical protein